MTPQMHLPVGGYRPHLGPIYRLVGPHTQNFTMERAQTYDHSKNSHSNKQSLRDAYTIEVARNWEFKNSLSYSLGQENLKIVSVSNGR